MARPMMLALMLSLVACEAPPSSVENPRSTIEVPVELPWRSSEDYSNHLRVVDSIVASTERRAVTNASSWMALETVAHAYVDRAKLTGDITDYVRALDALDRSFARAPENDGPWLSLASVSFAVHRLDEMDAAIERAGGAVLPAYLKLSVIFGLRGDLALHRSIFDEARAHYLESETLDPVMPASFRLALYEWQTGDFDAADALMVETIDRLGNGAPRTQAFLSLQRGLLDLDRGRYDDALAHYHEADAVFGGWWLIHEHIAEALALRGDTVAGDTVVAIAAYRDVVQRTRSPELMDALASLLAAEGRVEEASRLRSEAAAVYETQLELLPEAAYGHALDHFLVTFQRARALELARANFALRPNGSARVSLAQALALSGEIDEARVTIESALATVYDSSELHAVAAVIYDASGDREASDAQRDLAIAIQPDVMETISWWSDDVLGAR